MDKVTRLPLDRDRAVERRRLHIREVSDASSEVHATVGEELRAARLRLGEDLSAVSAALRIRQEHLEAIEEGAYDRLPGRAYAIGFVRAYAEYLGLDPVAIVARFKQEAGNLPEPSTQVPAIFDETHEEARQPQGLFIGIVVLFLLGIGVAVYFAQSADKMLTQRGGETPTEASSAAPQDKTAKAPGASETPAPEKSAAPAEAAKPAATPPAHTAETATPSAPATAPSGGQSYGAVSGPSRITISALRDGVWLRVEDQASGEVLITRKLKAGDHFLVPDRPNLVLVTRDGGSLELTLDGTSVGHAGAAGSVIDGMPLNPEALAARLPPPPPRAAAPAATPPAAADDTEDAAPTPPPAHKRTAPAAETPPPHAETAPAGESPYPAPPSDVVSPVPEH